MRLTRHTLAAALFASAALSACSAPEDQPLPAEPGTATTEVAPAATPVATPIPEASQALPAGTAETAPATTGGDGSPLALSPLTATDLSGVELAGELACSFSRSAGAEPLLLARGNAADAGGRATFAVKIGDYVEQGMMLADGGFDAMLEGGRFGTKGLVLAVRNVGPANGAGSESPSRPAELVAQRADGAERIFPGAWTCGP